MNKTTLNSQKEKHSIANFYPRSPCGERHLRMSLLFVCKNFYPRSPCGERRTGPVGGHIPDRISIHALLAESDVSSRKLPSSWRRFLSTLSLRRATRALAAKKLGIKISIHALLAESDVRQICTRQNAPIFLSTLSLRRATVHRLLCLYFTSISIHALLAESDISKRRYYHDKRYFYPRSPCGERRPRCAGIWFAACNFYPRSPCGERPITPVTGLFWQKFLSTLSLRRATLKSSISTKSALFLSTLSLRRATR